MKRKVPRRPTPNESAAFAPPLRAPWTVQRLCTSTLCPPLWCLGKTCQRRLQAVTSSGITSRNRYCRIYTPQILCWCDSRNHWRACLRWAFACKLAASSYSWKDPRSNTARRSDESMFFVKGSASCKAVGIQRKRHCSKHLSLMSKTSSVVLYSSHVGMARRLTRSNKDLQSVTTVAAGNCRNASWGHLQLNSGTTKVPHRRRHHPHFVDTAWHGESFCW